MDFPTLAAQNHWVVTTLKIAASQKGGIKPAIAVAISADKKIGKVSATHSTQATCGNCAFMGEACYAEDGQEKLTLARLNAYAVAHPATTPAQYAQAEADEIDRLPATRDLRLHVVGDCQTDAAAAILAAAAERYIARARARGYRVKVWTYTHQWRVVTRAAWGCVSVLASCDTPADIAAARARGYATAYVVAEMPATPIVPLADFTADATGRGLVCPQQRGTVADCAACPGVCKDDANMIARDITLLLVLHGEGDNFIQAKDRIAAAA